MAKGAYNWRRHNKSMYRSGLEDNVSKFLKDNNIVFLYEPKEFKITYTVPSVQSAYTPDFVLEKHDGTQMYIETKGLWTLEDRKKHFLIKDQYPELDIRFLFQNPNQKIRKGSKTTYADVCLGNLRGYGWFRVPFAKVEKNQIVPKDWLKEIKEN